MKYKLMMILAALCSLTAGAESSGEYSTEIYKGTLNDIITNCVQGMRVQVTDTLVCVWAIDDTSQTDVEGYHYHHIFCRDLNRGALDEKPSGYVDYVYKADLQDSLLTDGWDHSNWVIFDISKVCCTHKKNGRNVRAEDFLGYMFTLNDVVLSYKEENNHILRVMNPNDLDPIIEDSEERLKDKYTVTYNGKEIEPYTGWQHGDDDPMAKAVNTYITCNFVPEYQGQGTATNVTTGESLYFHTPRRSEVCYITWAVYAGVQPNPETGANEECFIIPQESSATETDSAHNQNNLNGSIEVVDWDYNKRAEETEGEGGGDVYGAPTGLNVGSMYQFNAIVVLSEQPYDADAPRRVSGKGDQYPTSRYGIYPLDIFNTPKEMTAIRDIVGEPSSLKSITYYNLNGLSSSTPFDGVNIRVMLMNNGQRRVDKVLIR